MKYLGIFMICWFDVLVYSTSLVAQNIQFSGVYIEILKKGDSYVLSGQYLVSEDSLLDVLKNPKMYVYNCKLKRIFNYTEFTFSELKLDIPHEEYIDWNYKVSLYRGNDYNDNILYQCNADTSFAFYIKRVSIEYDKLSIQYIGYDHSPLFSIYCDQIFLLRKINFQQKVPATEESIASYITPLSRYKTWKYWHPSLNDFVKIIVEGEQRHDKYLLPNW